MTKITDIIYEILRLDEKISGVNIKQLPKLYGPFELIDFYRNNAPKLARALEIAMKALQEIRQNSKTPPFGAMGHTWESYHSEDALKQIESIVGGEGD